MRTMASRALDTVLVLALVSTCLVASSVLAARFGDVDRDGVVSVGDVTILQRHLAGEFALDAEQASAADVAPHVGESFAPDGSVNVVT